MKGNYHYKVYISHRLQKFQSFNQRSWKEFNSRKLEWIQSLAKHFTENPKVSLMFQYIQQNAPLVISIDGSKKKNEAGGAES